MQRAANVLFGLAAAAAFLLILYMARRMSFHHDEWTFIDTRGSWELDAILRPHNEHFSAVLVLTYKSIFSLVGLGTYLPYLGVLLALHVAVATGVFRILSRASGPLLGLGAGVVMLFLGTGHENLYWAFQIGFVGASAAGVWALAFLQRGSSRGLIVAAVLMVVSVATQGIGLAYVAAGIVLALQSPRVLPRLLVTIPAVGIYLAWYLAYGQAALGQHRNPLTWDAVGDVPAYVVAGVAHAMGSVTGAGAPVGVVLFSFALGAISIRLLTGRMVSPLAVAALVGLLVLFGLTGSVRAQFGLEQAAASRYVYVAAVFVLLLLAACTVRLRRGRRRWAQLGVGVALVAFAVSTNIVSLVDGRTFFENQARENRAVGTVAMRYSSAPGIDQNRPLFPMPSLARLRELIANHGDFTTDVVVSSLVSPPTPRELDGALARILEPELRLQPASEPDPDARLPLLGLAASEVAVSHEDGCATLDAVGLNPHVTVVVPDGAALAYLGGEAGEVRIAVARIGPISDAGAIGSPTLAGTWYRVTAPILDDGQGWHYRVAVPPATDRARLCLVQD